MTRVEQRLQNASQSEFKQERLLYQHSAFCNMYLPRSLPDRSCQSLRAKNGFLTLELRSEQDLECCTETHEYGLPYGSKARLLLAHFNRQALISGKPYLTFGQSFGGFGARVLGHAPNGRELQGLKDQSRRLSHLHCRIGLSRQSPFEVNSMFVQASEPWLKGDGRGRTLADPAVVLSSDYFRSLQAHAVPLNGTHLMALAHTPFGIDVYCWLVQRLMRVKEPYVLLWPTIAKQWGFIGYERVRDFRRSFRQALFQVRQVYPTAKVSASRNSLILFASPSPIPTRLDLSGSDFHS